MSIARRLREERKRAGLSQADFADIAGVGVSTQKNYEAGRRAPDTDYLEKVQATVDVAYIITGRHTTAEDPGDYQTAKKIRLEFDPDVATEANRMTEQLAELFEFEYDRRHSVAPFIYGMLMTKVHGDTFEDMVKLLRSLGWPEKEK